MGEIKIFGYIIIAVLFLSIIIMPLVEMFFIYRERLILSDALYNSCRVASHAGYNYTDMRNIDAVVDEDAFREAFKNAFATSFGVDFLSMSGDTLYFRSNNDSYGNFEVELKFKQDPYTYAGDDQKLTEVEATASAPYQFKNNYMRVISNNNGIGYELASQRNFVMEIFN